MAPKIPPTFDENPPEIEGSSHLPARAKRSYRAPEQRLWYRTWRAAVATVERRGQPLTLEEAVALYLQDLERRGRQVFTTCRDSWYSLRSFLRWTAEHNRSRLADLDAELLLDYLKYLVEQELSVYYLKQIRSSLKQLSSFLFNAGWIDEDLTLRLRLVTRLPRNPGRRVLDSYELAHLLDMPKQWVDSYRGKWRQQTRWVAIRDEAILTLLIGTGIRSCEACSLEMQDLDLERGRAYVHSKSEHLYIRPQRMIFLDHPRLTDALGSYLTVRPQSSVKNLLTSSTGTTMYPQNIWRIVTKYARLAELGKEVTPHTLRHTFCSHLMAAGVDAYSVQRLMGHRQVAYTLRWYTHLTPEQLHAEWKAFQPLQKRNGS